MGLRIQLQIDLDVTDYQDFAIEAALYDADDWLTDTDKIFIWTQWGY